MSEDRTLLLEREKPGKPLLKYAFPAIIAMIASSLYYIADSIFIGQKLGALAISGLALTFPLMNLSAAFGSLVGVGGATMISIRLGEKDFDSASIKATPITTSKNFDRKVPILPIIFVVKPKNELKFNAPIILALSI